MIKNIKDDKWILDLSLNKKDRIKRKEIFQEYLDQRRPVWFNDHRRLNKERKYLSVFTWDDVARVTSDSKLFHSRHGYLINDLFSGMAFDGSLLSMSGDEHRIMRNIVAPVFSPGMVRQMEPMIERITCEAFESFLRKNNKSGDIFSALCSEIPLNINTEMMGVPTDLKYKILELTKYVVANDDPSYGNGDPMKWFISTKRLKKISLSIGQSRIGNPQNDITSLLLNSVGEEEKLTLEDYAQFFMLLVIAGMETTTHTFGHGIYYLSKNPDQMNLLKNNFEKYIDTACEEILRIEPPVMYFRRTASESMEINGVEINPGDRILTWYNCANMDKEKFNEPHIFNIERPKRPLHTTFGGPGIHHCLGANLARLQMKIFYRQLLEYMPNIKIDEEKITYVKSGWGSGYKNMVASW